MREQQVLKKLESLDPEKDTLEIVRLIANYDFVWDTARSLEFALFRTFAVPSIGNLLAATHEFEKRPQKRYDDTDLILSEMMEHGYDSERGREAIRRMNRIHGHFNITNDDFLYVLSTFVIEPYRWNQRFGYRKSGQKELDTSYIFWREVGGRMNIKDIPAGFWELKKFNEEYEAKHFAFTEGSRKVADSTLNLFLGWYVPKFMFPLARLVLFCFMDDALLNAFHYPKPPALLKAIVNGIMQTRNVFMRIIPLRTKPVLRTKREPILSYPHGYEVKNLGAEAEKGIGEEWLRKKS
jgi:hypothetical protein